MLHDANRPARCAFAGLVLALTATAPAIATDGEKVVSGQATFTRDGNVLQIDTSTAQTVINWYGGFNVPVDHTVVFNQPSALSNVANYDLSANPSLIDGTLRSNGGVWIINPVGVFFGDQAVVDVGRLVAGAGKMDPAEFLAGVEHWSELTGRVEVGAGAQIHAADSVLLLGAAVANYGHISAADGMIALVAGGEVRLTRADGSVMVTADRAIAPDPERWAVVQAGTVDAGKGSVSLTAGDAYSLAINHTGITRARDIEVAGGAGGVVSVSGSLDASDRSAGATGGEIAVTGERIALLGAQLDAAGDAGGGKIRVGGDLHGGGELPTALRTYVDEASSLRADAITAGDGGTIIVWSDEATRFYGGLSARGGALGGDGGFAEVSGASLESRGSIDLGASAGNAGTLLYDPKDIVIHSGSDPITPGESVAQVLFGTPDEVTTPFDIYETELEGANANILLQATNSIRSADTFSIDLINSSIEMDTRNDTLDENDSSFVPPDPGIHLANVSLTTTGAGAITLKTGTGSDTGVSAGIEVKNLTTAGGAVSVATEDGDISVGAVNTAGVAAGASGGNVTLESTRTGSVTVNGAIDASGADGTTGAGGHGGDVTIQTNGGDVTVNSSITASGGDGVGGGSGGAGGEIKLIADTDSGAVAPPGSFNRVITVNGTLTSNGGTSTGSATDAGALGGTGGSIGVSAGVNAGAGSVHITGPINASGGAGTAGGGRACSPTTTTCVAGPIRIEAHDDVTVTGNLTASGADTTAGGFGGAGGNGGAISIVSVAGNTTYTGALDAHGGTGLPSATAVNGAAGTASIEGHGAVTATLDRADVADLEVIESDVTGTVHVSGGAGITADGSGAVGSTEHTVAITTTDDAPHFTYRLADGGGEVEQVDLNTLVVHDSSIGAKGATIANGLADATQPEGERLLGRILGSGGSTDITLDSANLQLFATNIGVKGDGTAQQLTIGGTNQESVELTVAGDANAAFLDGLARIDVVQRSASGSIDLDLPGAGLVDIDGTFVDTGADRIESSLVKTVDTTGGPAFFFHLADPTASSAGSSAGEPLLRIARGAVDLGADAGFATTGNLELDDPTLADNGAAIDANGHTVVLIADSNRDGNGAIVASTRGTVDVADAATLVALSGSGVGEVGKPLRTSESGTTPMTVAGSGGTGDFRISNQGGDLRIATSPDLGVVNDGTVSDVTYRGVYAAGDVALENSGHAILLGDVQEGADETLRRINSAPSVGLTGPTAGTDQIYGFGDLRIPLTALTDATTGAPTVQSGGGQRYVGTMRLATDNTVLQAGDRIEFAGDIATDSPVNSLEVRADAFFEGDRTVTVGSGDFRSIDGSGDLAMRAQSQLTFRGDVGASSPPTSFAADADLLVFGTRTENGAIVSSADRIVAGTVALNTANPSTSPTATISDTSGGLSIESGDDVKMGAGEKLSATGALAIRAADTASLADLSAAEITVDAAHIVILGRDPGPVTLLDGSSITDRGVDWVANDIFTNVVPVWDGNGSAPTFALGSGAISTGGAVPFDVVRFAPNGDAVRPAIFAGTSDGRLNDLTGLGPRAVADARNDVPRAVPPVLPGLAARPGDEPPSPPRAVSGEELIGALHCRSAAGDPCAPPAVGDDPLASERALDIRRRYSALLASDVERTNLRAAFAPLGSVPAGDSAALSRALAHDPALDPARARIADLAVALAQIELLGLDAPESERARRAVAEDFAAATGVTGLDADGVLAAVDASGIAVLP
jgi:filamentous hemagglutinin family protein